MTFHRSLDYIILIRYIEANALTVLKSGVHATLVGVALAFLIPLNSKDKEGKIFSMSKEMEHDLYYWVNFFILPFFAFVKLKS
ncbi:MAG: hypothetical protein COB07_05935 [Sulfurovum sp.]|nr:MAG: hypothetical protein COB07_05935 [Sulfurovum sp.]